MKNKFAKESTGRRAREKGQNSCQRGLFIAKTEQFAKCRIGPHIRAHETISGGKRTSNHQRPNPPRCATWPRTANSGFGQPTRDTWPRPHAPPPALTPRAPRPRACLHAPPPARGTARLLHSTAWTTRATQLQPQAAMCPPPVHAPGGASH